MLPTINPISALACFVVFIVYVLRDKIDKRDEREQSSTDKSNPGYARPILRKNQPTPLQRDERYLDAETTLRTPTYMLQKRSQMRDISVQHDDQSVSTSQPQVMHQPVPFPFSVPCCQICSHISPWKNIRRKKKKFVKKQESPKAVENDTLSSLNITETKRAQANKSLHDFITKISKEPVVREYENKREKKESVESESLSDASTPNQKPYPAKKSTGIFTPHETKKADPEFHTFSKKGDTEGIPIDFAAPKSLFELNCGSPREEKPTANFSSKQLFFPPNDIAKDVRDATVTGNKKPEETLPITFMNNNEKKHSDNSHEDRKFQTSTQSKPLFLFENSFSDKKAGELSADISAIEKPLTTSMLTSEDKSKRPQIQEEKIVGQKDPLEAFKRKGEDFYNNENEGSSSFFKNNNIKNDLSTTSPLLPQGPGENNTRFPWPMETESKSNEKNAIKNDQDKPVSSLFGIPLGGGSTPLFPPPQSEKPPEPLFNFSKNKTNPPQGLFSFPGTNNTLFSEPQTTQTSMFLPNTGQPLFPQQQPQNTTQSISQPQPENLFPTSTSNNPFINSGNRSSNTLLGMATQSQKNIFQ